MMSFAAALSNHCGHQAKQWLAIGTVLQKTGSKGQFFGKKNHCEMVVTMSQSLDCRMLQTSLNVLQLLGTQSLVI